MGYVGRAQIGDMHTDEWLYDFIGRNLNTDLPQLAYELKSKLEFDLRGEVDDDAMILHLGGFGEAGGQWKPQVWFIRNVRGLDELGRPINVADEFDVSEEIDQPTYFQGQTGDQIRAHVERRAQSWSPFWFHQGYDLGTFNMLDQVLRAGMRAIIETHPGTPHPFPATLPEWSKHLKMAILAYGAYFAAFHEPFQQYVGGGADVAWAAWTPCISLPLSRSPGRIFSSPPGIAACTRLPALKDSGSFQKRSTDPSHRSTQSSPRLRRRIARQSLRDSPPARSVNAPRPSPAAPRSN